MQFWEFCGNDVKLSAKSNRSVVVSSMAFRSDAIIFMLTILWIYLCHFVALGTGKHNEVNDSIYYRCSFDETSVMPLPKPSKTSPVYAGLLGNQTCSGPNNRNDTRDWLKNLTEWIVNARRDLNLPSDIYQRPELQWVSSSFIQTQAMLHDKYLYDRKSGKFTVDRFLDDLQSRYGGLDSILLWHSYPNIGVDARSQFDMLNSLPGGIPKLKEVISSFQQRGVKVCQY